MYSKGSNNTCSSSCCWHIVHVLNSGMQQWKKIISISTQCSNKSDRKWMCERMLTVRPAAAGGRRWRHTGSDDVTAMERWRNCRLTGCGVTLHTSTVRQYRAGTHTHTVHDVHSSDIEPTFHFYLNQLLLSSTYMYLRQTCQTHTRLMALFRDYPGEPEPER